MIVGRDARVTDCQTLRGDENLLARAERVGGPATREILERQLARKRHPGEVIREALGVLRLVQDFSAERLEETAALALELGLYGYAAVNGDALISLPRVPVQNAANYRERYRQPIDI